MEALTPAQPDISSLRLDRLSKSDDQLSEQAMLDPPSKTLEKEELKVDPATALEA